MKRLVVFALCITIFFVLLGCGRKEKNKILDFKAKDVENIEIYRFDIPVEAEGMLVTEREDIEKVMKAFWQIKIQGDAKDLYLVGGELISFRFNLKNGEEFTLAYLGRVMLKTDKGDYRVWAEEVGDLWQGLDYPKSYVSEEKLPKFNN
ncbi:MAG TPA: hypothetical protein VK031_07885 [Tissierellaceae bacterium]|nr:hypothetical protein [Tissierellaceae bacterium]